MTEDEARKRMAGLIEKRRFIHERIAQAARPIVAVLLDAGRTNSADALKALFFELDALDQEMQQFVTENIENILKSLRP